MPQPPRLRLDGKRSFRSRRALSRARPKVETAIDRCQRVFIHSFAHVGQRRCCRPCLQPPRQRPPGAFLPGPHRSVLPVKICHAEVSLRRKACALRRVRTGNVDWEGRRTDVLYFVISHRSIRSPESLGRRSFILPYALGSLLQSCPCYASWTKCVRAAESMDRMPLGGYAWRVGVRL